MAVTQQGQIESRAARRVGGKGFRRCGFDAPARFGSTGLGRDAEPRQHHQHARALGCEHETARGVQIERFGISPDLADDGTRGRASRRVHGGTQAGDGVAALHEEYGTGVESEGVQAIGTERAEFAAHMILRDPYDGARFRGAACDGCRKAACRGGIGGTFGHDLVQCGLQQPATRRAVQRSLVERDAGGLA